MKWRYIAIIGFLLTTQLISRGQQSPSIPSAAPSPTAPALQDPAKASINGIVLKAGAGEPVRNATVTLRPVSGAVTGLGTNAQLPQAALPTQGQRGGQQQGQQQAQGQN